LTPGQNDLKLFLRAVPWGGSGRHAGFRRHVLRVEQNDMPASATFTWSSASGGLWTNGANWVGGTAPATSGGTANGTRIDLSTATTGPITLFAANGPGTIIAGAVTMTASATLDIDAGQTLAASAIAPAGSFFSMNNGEVDLLGGTLKYDTISVNGGEVFGYGSLTNPLDTATVSTSGGGEIVADVNGGGGNGTLDIFGSANNDVITISGNYQIDTGAVLEFGANTSLSAGSSPVVNFDSSNGTLDVATLTNNADFYTANGNVNTLNSTLDNLAVGATGGSPTGASDIYLFTGGSSDLITSGTIIGGSTLEAVVNSSTFQFDTNGSFAGDHLNWSTTDSSGGASIWVDTNPCYLAGTRILTENGEVAVEDLAEGDRVVTLSGDVRSLRPVRWVGQRRINLRQHAQPNLAAPVRVRQHAFGEDLPARDLLVSPDHCLFVDGKLIPAKLLINDMTIVQERGATSVHYYHVELDQHSVMFAEGLPAESYLDTGNRAMFANAGLALVLHPEFEVNAHLKCWETDACAPLTVRQDVVKPIGDSLAERAEALGYQRQEFASTTDPELRLVADGRVIRPLSGDGNRYVFTLPAGVSSVRLTSRASVPSYFEAYVDDWRHLGVAVRRIVVRDSAGLIEIPPDHPGLTQGWHQVERNASTMWRWMNGDAVLPISSTDGPVMVEVQVGMSMKHIVEGAAQGRLAA
jgi:hypothetical protein